MPLCPHCLSTVSHANWVMEMRQDASCANVQSLSNASWAESNVCMPHRPPLRSEEVQLGLESMSCLREGCPTATATVTQLDSTGHNVTQVDIARQKGKHLRLYSAERPPNSHPASRKPQQMLGLLSGNLNRSRASSSWVGFQDQGTYGT